MQRSANDVWVGLFVMIGVAALLFLALQSANLLSLQTRQQLGTISLGIAQQSEQSVLRLF